MIPLLTSVMAASLLGSLHCAGMCGGIAAVATAPARAESRATRGAELSYHGGRLVVYVSLGAAAGVAGSTLDWSARSIGAGEIAALASGVVMLLWGVLRILPAPALQRSSSGASAYGRLIGALHRFPDPARPLALGLASGLLPCGWLYAFVVAAAGTASPLHGALVLAAFWSGTVPVLLGIGHVLNRVSARVQRALPVLSGVVLIVVGLSNLWVHYQVPGEALKALEQSLPGATPGAPSCH